MPQDICLDDRTDHQISAALIFALLGAAFVGAAALSSTGDDYRDVTPNALSAGTEDWHGNVRRSH